MRENDLTDVLAKGARNTVGNNETSGNLQLVRQKLRCLRVRLTLTQQGPQSMVLVSNSKGRYPTTLEASVAMTNSPSKLIARARPSLESKKGIGW